MDIKISDAKRVAEANKKKKTGRTDQTGGTSFADMLDEASGPAETGAASGVTGVGGIAPRLYDQADPVPQDARGRSKYLLERLEELQQDVLAGNPTAAAEKLRRALATKAIDLESLPPHLRALVDEIDMRASVEVAKLEVGKKRG